LPGVIGTYESCAEFDLIKTVDGLIDRGGCLNLLTPARTMSRMADGITPNNCLVDVEKWQREKELVA
jgi:trimethylamine-N-oxide reductase (cytochrome c)